MKKIHCILGAALTASMALAQGPSTQKADALFDTYQYPAAASAYQKLVDGNMADPYVHKKLADSHYRMGHMQDAAKWYAMATKEPQDAETHYRYAQALKAQGDYAAAARQMDIFARMAPQDGRARAHVQGQGEPGTISEGAMSFDVSPTAINSDSDDFGPVVAGSELYFTSSRNDSGRRDQWSDRPYLDIYRAARAADGTLSDPQPVTGLNTPYHDGPLTISADGTTMIFSRDGHSQRDFKKIANGRAKLAQQGLYRASLVDGKWTHIRPLPFNSNEYSVTHPCLSPDGKALYFASDMPGGIGDVDIWMVSVDGEAYGQPKNLGPRVNTPGKEGFPFISEGNVLYFASSARPGFGGLDIFKVDLSKNDGAINLGPGINSKSDDFGLFLLPGLQMGYFASNRTGVDNIYGATPVCSINATASVYDANTKMPLQGALAEFHGERAHTDDKGNAEFSAPCGTYTLTVSKMGYQTASFNVKADGLAHIAIQAPMLPEEVTITETEVRLAPIYFEFDRSDITQQGAIELDKLARAMKRLPELNILVRAHTDTKGSKTYNLALSQKRAQATVDYIVGTGIDPKRLSAKGMGSSQPLVDCKNNCSETQDATNRRSEFIIVK